MRVPELDKEDPFWAPLQRYRFWKDLRLALVIGFVPFIAVVWLLASNEAVRIGAAVTWAFLIYGLEILVWTFRCPRCNHRFHSRRTWLTKCCRSCRLSEGAIVESRG